MPPVGYDLDTASGRFVRSNAAAPALAGDIVLPPGQLADIADGGRLQDILSGARSIAVERLGPAGDADLLKTLWSLHEEGGVLLVRWRSLTGFHNFAPIVEAAWRAAGEWAFIHYVSTEAEPICWSDGVDPFDARYVRR